jgi:hypothetical protein
MKWVSNVQTLNNNIILTQVITPDVREKVKFVMPQVMIVVVMVGEDTQFVCG